MFLYCLVKRCFGRFGLDLVRDSGRFGLDLLLEASGVADQFCFVGNLIRFSVNVYIIKKRRS